MSDRNLNPHAEARVAMALWSDRYSKQTLGCMDFYDGLTVAQKSTCAQIVDGIIHADRADGRSPAPLPISMGAWLPIERADKSTDRIYDFPGMPRPIGNSEEYWCRDAEGRVFLATWADDGKRAYWWDLNGESPVDPVEFMPHPLDPRFAALSSPMGGGE